MKNYNFRHLQLPDDHNFDDDQLQFLKTIDEAFIQTKDGHNDLKEQINAAFIEMEKIKTGGAYTPGPDRPFSKKERDLNRQWLKAVLRRKPTEHIEKELAEYHEKDFDDYLDTGEVSTGGYLVPELLLTEIYHYVEQNGVCRRDMRYLPFSGAGNTRKLPVENSGVSVDWIEEGELKPISNISLSQVTQEIKKLACISVLTEELLEDSSVDLISYVSLRIGEAIAAEEDSQFFSGVGTPWTGILNNANIVPVAMDAGKTIEDVGPDDLLDLIFAVNKGYRPGAKFYMSSDVLMHLMKYRSSSISAGDNEGQYLASSPMSGAPDKIWGYPIVVSDVLPGDDDATDPDTPFMFFGNLQKCGVYGDKKG